MPVVSEVDVVVVVDDVVVSDRTAPPAAAGRAGAPEWQPASPTRVAAVTNATHRARLMPVSFPARSARKPTLTILGPNHPGPDR